MRGTARERLPHGHGRKRRPAPRVWGKAVLAGFLGLAMLGCASNSGQTAPADAAPILAPGAPSQTFAAWVMSFRAQALAHGISPATYDEAFRGVAINPQIITSDRNQPEFSQQIWTYLSKAVSDFRVQKGRDQIRQNAALLDAIEQAYGVQKEILVAIWGLESSYGAFIGKINVIEALATLAYQGRRRAFGRRELLAALDILERGYASKDQLKGSWAGAMGHTQFIPSTYLHYAVDYDGDRRRNVWSDLGDVFASTANYLAQSGWQAGLPWGYEVRLRQGFDYSQADKTIVKSVAQWERLGVLPVAGASLKGARNQIASLLLPGGHTGPAFLITQNFRTLLRYNNSTAYALAAALLADRLHGAGALKGAWPVHEPPLNRKNREDLQRGLNALGYDAGEVDGIIGARTRAALKLFQRDNHLPVDGFPTGTVLTRLRQTLPR